LQVYNHYKQQQLDDEVETGQHHHGGTNRNRKTLVAKPQNVDVPLAIVDVTVYTEAGYVEDKVF
jgi:ATP-dependent Clp protease ATP-binding subunit ClpX